MKLPKMLGSWEKSNQINIAMVFSCAVQALVILILVIKLSGVHEQTRLVPPNLDRAVSVGWNTADKAYLESFGMYAVTVMMNVTPKTVAFIADSVSAFIDPSIYPAVRSKMLSLAEDPVFRTSAASVVFTPGAVEYEPMTKKVFVLGQMNTSSAGSQGAGPRDLVYELVLEMRQGRPWITAVDSYPGNKARTQLYLSQHPEIGKETKPQ